MTSVIAFAPIAAQLARGVSLDELFPRGVIEDVLRQEALEEDEEELPDDVAPFFEHYVAVTRAAVQLLGAPAFDRLARFHDEIEEVYMPGGPPVSPVYDSFSMQFVLGAVPQGPGNETPYSVLARLLLRDPTRAPLQRMAQTLADARFELYRVTSAKGHDARIEPVRGGDALSVRLTGPFLRTGDFGLMRVLPFEDRYYIADSPYLLQASEDDWREHLARVVVQRAVPKPATPAAMAAPTKPSKLSSKELARRRQKEKAKASRNEPEVVIKRYLHFGLSDRYWFDYIMDAYAGERNGIVLLAGVPDRPELLPHSAAYSDDDDDDDAPEPGLTPVLAFRQKLLRTAIDEGLIDLALQELQRLSGSSDPELSVPSPNEHGLLAAYATFGLRAKDGSTVLTRFERSNAAESLSPEVHAFIDSIKSGWFTVLRADRIHLDKGIDAFDLLRGQELYISERAATRQLGRGDLMLGWLRKDPSGTLTFEGALTHVPAFTAPPFTALVDQLRSAMPPARADQAWKDAAADLPLPLIAGILELRANPPLPDLASTHRRKAGKKTSKPAPLELPPELAAQLQTMVLTQIRSTLDKPIPEFKGKTLRQVARNAKTRPDAVNWLREQERILQSNPQLAGLDMRPLWEELSLPFQGLETDPLR